MPEPHIVKSYDDELGRLNDAIARMAGLAETQLTQAIQALVERDDQRAAQVIASDAEVDRFEEMVNEQVARLLALRAPVADDLRVALSALKVAASLERMADYAANAAKRSLVLNQLPPIPALRSLSRMGWLVIELSKEVMDCYLERDADRAMIAWERDQEVDELHSSLFRELLTYMMEDPRNIASCTHLLFIAKNVERIGDLATNIAEMTWYLVNGGGLRRARPKRDTSAYAMPRGDRSQ
ncbi:MAG: phosphate signaling complex protein PhoU [Alphaproteobacteria bacterium]|nr:phosphate signaling complex protein PhoU [Alphaproteobacteria bacterium]